MSPAPEPLATLSERSRSFALVDTGPETGMISQAVAERARLPSIVLLLCAGVLLRRDGLGWLDPSDFGHGQHELVALAVIVIL
ncbi:MAG: hypothetical protein HC767_10725, partial [Akkermansiaceae bacterium]|nr:hypothetical protein [Akkermansiaceae bacterium]